MRSPRTARTALSQAARRAVRCAAEHGWRLCNQVARGSGGKGPSAAEKRPGALPIGQRRCRARPCLLIAHCSLRDTVTLRCRANFLATKALAVKRVCPGLDFDGKQGAAALHDESPPRGPCPSSRGCPGSRQEESSTRSSLTYSSGTIGSTTSRSGVSSSIHTS